MSLLGTVDVYADELRRTLAAKLPGLIAADNQANLDYELKPPAGYSDGTEDVFTFPWVEVAPGDGRIENLSLGAADADIVLPIICVGWIQEVLSVKKLHRLLLRFGSVIIQAGADPDAFGGGPTIDRIEWQARRNPAPEAGEPEQVTSAVQVYFWLSDVARLR